eukprot:CAMPEP_0201576866 /NCGR_PEP_ID=MMETSP0190_2-20130828/22928_1 /ASSEMBLY_ACC=CAM_ASM_000263 /TAXON_ID=37353 /ORGANISM="Rosalina sp." /LENGTH=384 /DNA_ID=CAMNT_0048008237 /DNA_START=76 /DNA_END=1230 /DNA_ORIENTATION=-
MKIIILSTILIYQAVSYEYGGYFADITYCGSDEKAYPFCASVDESPIDLDTFRTVDGDRVHCNGKEIDWDYNGHNTFDVVKEEHTIQVNMPGRSEGKPDKSIASFKNPVDPLTSKTKVDRFCLEQVHFHWDDDNKDLGSEHAVDGDKYPLEVHFVHFNCDRQSVTDVQNQYPTQQAIYKARKEGRDVHELGVIGVFFNIKGNKDNPAIDRILDAIEEIEEKEREKCKFYDIREANCVIDQRPDSPNQLDPELQALYDRITVEREELLTEKMSGIDLSDILSDDILESGYWTYEGSLTTPPCTDDVRWFNMKEESYISQAQWDRYRRITRPCDFDTLMAPNWRPLQENPNPVFECHGRHHRHHPPCYDNGDDSDDSNDSNDSGDR